MKEKEEGKQLHASNHDYPLTLYFFHCSMPLMSPSSSFPSSVRTLSSTRPLAPRRFKPMAGFTAM